MIEYLLDVCMGTLYGVPFGAAGGWILAKVHTRMRRKDDC